MPVPAILLAIAALMMAFCAFWFGTRTSIPDDKRKLLVILYIFAALAMGTAAYLNLDNTQGA